MALGWVAARKPFVLIGYPYKNCAGTYAPPPLSKGELLLDKGLSMPFELCVGNGRLCVTSATRPGKHNHRDQVVFNNFLRTFLLTISMKSSLFSYSWALIKSTIDATSALVLAISSCERPQPSQWVPSFVHKSAQGLNLIGFLRLVWFRLPNEALRPAIIKPILCGP